LSYVKRRSLGVVLVCLLAAAAAGCGSSSHGSAETTQTTATTHATQASRLAALEYCLRQNGYIVTPITPAALRTAPRRFEFITVLNLQNPNRVPVAVAVSRSLAGATRAAKWTRKLNAKIGKGVVKAPVVQLDKIDVLWTAEPQPPDRRNVYSCVIRASARRSTVQNSSSNQP
jgi:hypothetical protein